METEQKSNGALIGLIIIVVILMVGGIYFWQKSRVDNLPAGSDTGSLGGASAAELEASVESMDLEGLDSDI